jgi:hypothetical protein
MTLKRILSFLLIFLLWTSCSRNPLDVDASKVQVNIGFVNLDSIFVNSDFAQLIKQHHKHLKEINEIYEYELGYCLGVGNPSDTAFLRSVRMFLSDPYIARLENRIAEKFPSLENQKKEIVSGFKYLKFHLPSAKLPENIVFMNSFFAANAFSTEKQIGVGLERYLGMKTDVIKELPGQDFPEWMREGMDAQFLSRDVLCSWIMTHCIDEVKGNLADNIVRWGKVLYLTQAAFPESNPATILRYSEADYKWAIENEYSLWKYLVDQKMLFKIDDLNTTNLLNDGPFTPGLPEKGPDRLGQFLGLRIIEAYMKEKEITIQQLINTPYANILIEYEID